LASAVT